MVTPVRQQHLGLGSPNAFLIVEEKISISASQETSLRVIRILAALLHQTPPGRWLVPMFFVSLRSTRQFGADSSHDLKLIRFVRYVPKSILQRASVTSALRGVTLHALELVDCNARTWLRKMASITTERLSRTWETGVA